MATLNHADAPDIAERLDYASNQIGEFQELIRFADAKAGAAVTFVAALFTVLSASYGSVLELLRQLETLWIGLIVLVISLIFILTSLMVLYYAFQTFLPRVGKAGQPQETVAFFGDVVRMGEERFIEQVCTMPVEDLLQHVLREVFLLSEIVAAKFAAQRRCFQYLRVLLPVWAIAQIAVLLAP